MRDDGKVLTFTLSGSIWITSVDINSALKQVFSPDGWQYQTGLFEIENYNANGQLTSVTDRAGLTQTLSYEGGRLATVINPFGRSLTFLYTGANVTSVKLPEGDIYQYGYDANNNLSTVTYPDNPVNAVRTFLYDNISFPHALTGVIDENNVRYSTDDYDSKGRDISNRLAGGVNKVSLDFTAQTNDIISVTDALNVTRTSIFTIKNGSFLETNMTRSCPTCTGANVSAQTATRYDANGNISSQTDFNNYKTCYAYEMSLNLEKARVEGLNAAADCVVSLAAGASLKAPARRTSTFWINTRLPKIVAQPNKITYYTYDANGNTLTKTERSTVDNTGVLGFNGSWTDDPPRIWTYTYDNFGQVKTADGPRSDVSDITNFDYYTDTTPDHIVGDLHTITNALGQVTTFNRYDRNGRPTVITAPDNVVTTLDYTPRSQLKTLTVTGGARC